MHWKLPANKGSSSISWQYVPDLFKESNYFKSWTWTTQPRYDVSKGYSDLERRFGSIWAGI